MKITTRGRYALQGLVDLIANSNGKAVKLADIAARQDLPLFYLEQLFRQLRLGGVVKSVRGPGGGYVLSRDASEITLHEILKSVEETESAKLPPNATREAISAHKVLTRMDEAVGRVLAQPLSSLL